MEKDNKKKVTPNINEEVMMNLMVDGVKKEGLNFPQEEDSNIQDNLASIPKETIPAKVVTREKSKIKRAIENDYESAFFKKSDTNARDGKTVYIRPEFHEKLTRIIQVIGEDKISIYAYLDNLLEYHFKEYGEQITRCYNEKYKPI